MSRASRPARGARAGAALANAVTRTLRRVVARGASWGRIRGREPWAGWTRAQIPVLVWGTVVLTGGVLWAVVPRGTAGAGRDPADAAWVVPQATDIRRPVNSAVLARPQPLPTATAQAAIAQFRADLRAVSADLYATGRVSPGRARYLGYWMVAESYRQQVPPALVFGIMSVEDPRYRFGARSAAGARGVMQVMPTVWIPALGALYGQDLTDDRTNIAMGVHILRDALTSAGGEWPRALLRYNGCVRGTRTPTCFDYPEQVRRRVERLARWSCPSRNFDLCVAGPLRTGWMERRWERRR